MVCAQDRYVARTIGLAHLLRKLSAPQHMQPHEDPVQLLRAWAAQLAADIGLEARLSRSKSCVVLTEVRTLPAVKMMCPVLVVMSSQSCHFRAAAVVSMSSGQGLADCLCYCLVILKRSVACVLLLRPKHKCPQLCQRHRKLPSCLLVYLHRHPLSTLNNSKRHNSNLIRVRCICMGAALMSRAVMQPQGSVYAIFCIASEVGGEVEPHLYNTYLRELVAARSQPAAQGPDGYGDPLRVPARLADEVNQTSNRVCPDN